MTMQIFRLLTGTISNSLVRLVPAPCRSLSPNQFHRRGKFPGFNRRPRWVKNLMSQLKWMMQQGCEIAERKRNSPVSADQHEAVQPSQQQLQLRYQLDLAAKRAICDRNTAVKFVCKSPTLNFRWWTGNTASATLHMANLTFGYHQLPPVTFGFATIWNCARTVKCPRETSSIVESDVIIGEQQPVEWHESFYIAWHGSDGC